MDFDEARKVKRPTIRVGRRYPFYSTVTDARITEPDGPRFREYTAQMVRVLKQTFKPGDEQWISGESERFYRVRADDGQEFEAYQGELNGWFKDTGQFYGPSGVFGSEK